MKAKYKPGQHIYFLVCGRFVTKASVVTSNSYFVTISFRKQDDDCIIRLPYGRIFPTEEEARKHIHPDLPPFRQATKINAEDEGDYVCTRRWELWE